MLNPFCKLQLSDRTSTQDFILVWLEENKPIVLDESALGIQEKLLVMDCI